MSADTRVTITKKEYDRLKDNEHQLRCLEAAGIDNTEAYSEGMRQYRKEKGDDEDADSDS